MQVHSSLLLLADVVAGCMCGDDFVAIGLLTSGSSAHGSGHDFNVIRLLASGSSATGDSHFLMRCTCSCLQFNFHCLVYHLNETPERFRCYSDVCFDVVATST